MHSTGRRKDVGGDEPPYLTEGTEVSAKYKGAFCEAKVRKVVHSVKCRINLKQGGATVVQDDQIKGALMVGANVEVKLPDKKDLIEGSIVKIQDCSQYTVVFDDGDITTLRRSALCLKSGRHFAEGDTLDKLPLTHPEHFSNPVVNNRRGRRSRQAHDDSLDDDSPKKGKKKEEREVDIGKVVCVEIGDKKKVKDNWFPGLVVEPTAQDAVKINVKDEYLVRSFKDGRYYTVPKKEAFEFTREIGAKVDNNSLRSAVEKAVLFLDSDELPPHWDRDLLFGLQESSDSDSNDGSESEPERLEDKDQFVAKLFTFMEDCGSPINTAPAIYDEDIDLHKLFKVVEKLGGFNKVNAQNQWKLVTQKLNLMNATATTSTANLVKNLYKKYLHGFEEFNRKLGCTMQSSPNSKSRRRTGGRSIIRERDRATPVIRPSAEKEKQSSPPAIPTPKAEKKPEKIKPAKVEKKLEETPTKKDSKVRSERLQNKKEESGIKKRLWKEESQSDNEAGPSQIVKPETPSTPEPKWTKRRAESEWSSDEEDASAKEKREKRSKPKPQEEESKKKSETPDRKIIESVTPVRDEKKTVVKVKSKDGDDSGSSTNGSNSTGQPVSIAKKRGRKRKESDKGEELAFLSSDIQVQVGDKLKVYYGPQDEAKVTYEAKVVDLDSVKSLYMVHYTGWNTRYDEWVPRGRIASNLSWTPARAKRSGRQPAQPSPSPLSKGPQKTSSMVPSVRPTRSGKESSTRSTTPSSVTSSSSRTKSPAQSSRAQRAVKRSERLRRPRRISGPDDKYSDSESDDSDVEMDDSSRSRVRRDSTSGSDTKVSKRKVMVKKEPMDDDDDSDSKEDDDPPADEQKGRNFNLSQLRSEMKGFDKAIKTPDAAVEAPRASEGSKSDSSLAKESKSDDSMDDDDIYAFKEPEPFKPESRLKREPVSDESKFKPTKPSPTKQDSPAAKRKISKKDKPTSIDLPAQEDKRKRRAASKQEEIVIEKQEWSAGSGDSFKSNSSPCYASDIPSTSKKPIYASTSLFGDPHSGQEDEEIDDQLIISESTASDSPSLPFELDCVEEGAKDTPQTDKEKDMVELVVKTDESEEGTLTKVPVGDSYRKYLDESSGSEDKWPKRKEVLINETIERVVQHCGDDLKKIAKPDTSKPKPMIAVEAVAAAKVTVLKAVPISEVKSVPKDVQVATASKIKVEEIKEPKKAPPPVPGKQYSILVPVAKKPEAPKVDEEKAKTQADVLSTKPLQSWKSNSRELCKSLRKEPRKKALKKTVSKEFIDDDSSSNSESSEDLKLVIDRQEDESGNESSDSDSEKKPLKIKQEKKKAADEEESSLNSLLCEETIPGSPVPGEDQVVLPKKVSVEPPKVREMPFASMVAGGSSGEGGAEGPSTSKAYGAPVEEKPEPRKDENDAAPVMENTPPTTPDSNSSLSGSPDRDQREGSPKQESGKSEQDLSEVDLDSPADGTKMESEDSLLNVDVGCDSPTAAKGKSAAQKKAAAAAAAAKEAEAAGKKAKRKSRKEADIPTPKRPRYSSGRGTRNMDAGSDSDDNTEGTNLLSLSIATTDNLLANQPSRPSRYNFYSELDPSMECSQRINLLQSRLQELRKTYMSVKAELAFIDRRRKKLRRKERDASKSAASKQEVWCAT